MASLFASTVDKQNLILMNYFKYWTWVELDCSVTNALAYSPQKVLKH